MTAFPHTRPAESGPTVPWQASAPMRLQSAPISLQCSRGARVACRCRLNQVVGNCGPCAAPGAVELREPRTSVRAASRKPNRRRNRGYTTVEYVFGATLVASTPQLAPARRFPCSLMASPKTDGIALTATGAPRIAPRNLGRAVRRFDMLRAHLGSCAATSGKRDPRIPAPRHFHSVERLATGNAARLQSRNESNDGGRVPISRLIRLASVRRLKVGRQPQLRVFVEPPNQHA